MLRSTGRISVLNMPMFKTCKVYHGYHFSFACKHPSSTYWDFSPSTAEVDVFRFLIAKLLHTTTVILMGDSDGDSRWQSRYIKGITTTLFRIWVFAPNFTGVQPTRKHTVQNLYLSICFFVCSTMWKVVSKNLHLLSKINNDVAH